MKPEPVRWALIARPYNRLVTVLLQHVDREVAQGAILIAREDKALCQPATVGDED